MSEFTLPSGRVVKLPERGDYGVLCDAQDAQAATGKPNDFYFALITGLTGLTISEARALDPDDGRALETECMLRVGKRSVEAEAPFVKPSPSISETTVETSIIPLSSGS